MKLVHVLVGVALSVSLGLSIGSYLTTKKQLRVLEQYSEAQHELAKEVKRANDELQGVQAQCRVLEQGGMEIASTLDAHTRRMDALEFAADEREGGAEEVVGDGGTAESETIGTGKATFLVGDVEYAVTLFDVSGGVLQLAEGQEELFDELVSTLELQRAIVDQYVEGCLVRGKYRVVTEDEAATIARELGGKVHTEQRDDGVLIVELDESVLQTQKDITKDVNRMRRALGASMLECKGDVVGQR